MMINWSNDPRRDPRIWVQIPVLPLTIGWLSPEFPPFGSNSHRFEKACLISSLQPLDLFFVIGIDKMMREQCEYSFFLQQV